MSLILEIPWEQQKYLKIKYQLRPRGGSMFIFSGNDLPFELKQFATEDYSYSRWIEDDVRLKNKEPRVPNRKPKTVFKPFDHQMDGAKEIYKAAISGNPGFMLADKTGVGKTLTSLTAITALAKKNGFTKEKQAKLLVVCPKGVIPVWRQTIQSYPLAGIYLRVMILNYQQLNKLLTESQEMKNKEKARKAAAKKRGKKAAARTRSALQKELAGHGVPTIDWDFIVFDESHALKNFPKSLMSRAAVNVAKLNKAYVKGKSPFVIYSTATPGSSPLNFAVMANWLSPLISKNKTVATPLTWGDFLIKQGFAVKKGKVDYSWASAPWYGKDSDNPAERAKYERLLKETKIKQRTDAKRIGQALTSPSAPFIMRSPKDIAGWPEQQFIPLPIALDSKAMAIYQEAWSTFRNWLRLTPAKSDPKAALVQQLRYRQKSSLLKVDALIDQIVDFVETGHQVFVSVEFIETLEEYKRKLEARGIKAAEISGRNTLEREDERLKFQKGLVKVVLCTVTSGISLHAGETLPDGSKATVADRITLIHDTRQNNLDTMQCAGRAHRSGVNSITYIPLIEDTVDESVISSFVNKTANMQTMTGSSTAEVEELEDIFRAALED